MAQTLLSFQGTQFKLFASPWSAPAWMKTNGQMEHGGQLKGDIDGPYYQTWANYFVRYFEEYAKNGITFWGVTMQNEPDASQRWQSMIYNSSMERYFWIERLIVSRDYAKGLWGQTLLANPTTKSLKRMVLDHNRNMVIDYSNTVISFLGEIGLDFRRQRCLRHG